MRDRSWNTWLFQRVSAKSLLKHYLPISGVASHGLFTVHLFSPAILNSMCKEWSNVAQKSLLASSLIGSGIYIFFRPHLHRVSNWQRVEYSVFAASMHNFGSLLFSIFIKRFIPSSLPTAIKTVLALSVSAFLTSRSLKYLHHIDDRSLFVKDFNFEHMDE
uniref:Uncharacterized protein n=1 Tax=Rhabditophanes sp. KR3021 TaxID=114890 RepID=A0AC35U7B3_9BILA